MSIAIGIIGAGKIVEDAHLPSLLNIPEARVAWIADPSAPRTALLSAMYGVRTIAPAAVEGALTGLDACLLAVPVGVRRPYMEMCARAGVAVYAEKPFALDAAEHAHYAGLFPAHRIAVGFQRRFYQSTMSIRTLIAGGMLGRLREVSFSYGSYNLKTGGATSYLSNAALSGGGMIIESAIHGLDQIIHGTYAEAVTVTSARSVMFNGSDFDTVSEAEIRVHGEPVPVRCEITRLRNLASEITYHFDHTTVRQGTGAEGELTIRGRGAAGGNLFTMLPQSAGQRGARSAAQAMVLIWEAFLGGLRSGQVNASSAVTSTLTTSWVDQIHQRIAP